MATTVFLDHTAFVIAADDRTIRNAVKAHFRFDVDLDDDLITNYFDKLIQVPIRVPPLGTQDVRAYLMLLFIEDSGLPAERRDELRKAVCDQFGQTWRGKRVDAAYGRGLIADCPDELSARLDLADRLASTMATATATATRIAGNPRLIKRFLNTLSIRIAIARNQSVTVDEEALAKMLLFERCGDQDAYTELVTAVASGDEGRPDFLIPWEEAARKAEEIVGLKAEWDTPFVRDWLALDPALGGSDLRAIVYVSREHMPVITPADELSSTVASLCATASRGPSLLRHRRSPTLPTRTFDRTCLLRTDVPRQPSRRRQVRSRDYLSGFTRSSARALGVETFELRPHESRETLEPDPVPSV